jgi:hypothetical protein
MEFNESKFELMRYGKHPDDRFSYKTEGGMALENKSSLRDLGVIVQDSGRFQEHIDLTVKKCQRQILGLESLQDTRIETDADAVQGTDPKPGRILLPIVEPRYQRKYRETGKYTTKFHCEDP